VHSFCGSGSSCLVQLCSTWALSRDPFSVLILSLVVEGWELYRYNRSTKWFKVSAVGNNSRWILTERLAPRFTGSFPRRQSGRRKILSPSFVQCTWWRQGGHVSWDGQCGRWMSLDCGFVPSWNRSAAVWTEGRRIVVTKSCKRGSAVCFRCTKQWRVAAPGRHDRQLIYRSLLVEGRSAVIQCMLLENKIRQCQPGLQPRRKLFSKVIWPGATWCSAATGTKL